MHRLTVVLRDSVLIMILGAALALTFNALRPTGGIPIIATTPYQTIVPCPEPLGDALPLEATEAWPGSEGDLLVDARSAHEHQAWAPSGSLSVPFDFLDPVEDKAVADLVATGARRIVVFGDGGLPDTGESLARELSGRGVRHVYFVTGGVDALRAHPQDPARQEEAP